MIKNKTIYILFVSLLFLTQACKKYVDPVIESVNETKEVLTDHTWVLTDYQVIIKNEDIPPPLLLNVNDSLIKAGNYHLSDMVPEGESLEIYAMQFTEDNKILSDISNTGSFIDQGGSYFIFNDINIRLKPAGVDKLIYNYYYDPDKHTMDFTVNEESANKAIDNATDRLTNWVIAETPNKIGDAIAQRVDSSQKLQETVHDFLVDAIAGKLSAINDFNPENAADTLAGLMMKSIDSVDWQSKLSEAINTELQKISSINPDSLAPIIAQKVADSLQVKFSTENIYHIVLPYMEGLAAQDPETMANNIATLLVHALETVFSEDNLQQIINPIWTKFTQLTDLQVRVISNKLTSITQDHWLNTDTLSQVFLPFTLKIDETPITQMGSLAQQCTDSLEIRLANLNETYPELDLNPDYDQIKTEIQAVLLAAKPIIHNLGADTVAVDIANLILDNFLSTETLNEAFTSAINRIQAINPAIAASTISTWLINLEQNIAPEIIEWLSDKLSPIIDNADPEHTAMLIAEKLNEFAEEHFTEENIESKVYPILQKITSINTEALANALAKTFLNSSLIQEGFTQENIASKLLPIFEDIHSLDPQNISENIVDALSEVFRNNYSPQRLSKIISFLLYKKAWENYKIANNFEELTITLTYE